MIELEKSILRPRQDLSDGQVHAICDVVRNLAFGLHKFLGPGFREKVYERGLIHRMRKAGIQIQVQPSVMIHDEDGTELIEENMDIIVENVLVLELKAVRET